MVLDTKSTSTNVEGKEDEHEESEYKESEDEEPDKC